jgi:hypothetical protein
MGLAQLGPESEFIGNYTPILSSEREPHMKDQATVRKKK